MVEKSPHTVAQERTDKKKKEFEMNEKLNDELKSGVVLPFRPKLITATGGPTGSNWLSKLKIGTSFLTRRKATKQENPLLEEYQVIQNQDVAVQLFTGLNQQMYMWVDSGMFSGMMELVLIISEPTDE